MNGFNRRRFLQSAVGGAATYAAPSLLAPRSAQAQQPPNVAFFLVDDLGWIDVGCYGSDFYETPNIDRLAKMGMRFTDGYAACPVCSPTRAAIMTGKHPARLNITDWIPGSDPKTRRLLGTQDEHQLPLSETTLAEAFKQNGYKTFFAGKWHLGDKGHFPEDQGFDINKGGHHKGSPPGGYYSPYQNPKLSDGPEGEYLTNRLTDESIGFIKRSQNDPFFLCLSYYNVHTPIQAYQKRVEHFKRKAGALGPASPEQMKEHNGWSKQRQDNPDYASMIAAVDESVGRLLDTLDELKLTDDTIIVFTSDNGGLCTLGRPGFPTSNLPLRAGKGWCYEGGIRVPFIIHAPGTAAPGSVCGEPAASMDFYPTLLDLCGIEAMPDQHRDGENLAPLLTGASSLEREDLFWHYPHYHGSTWAPGAAVRSGDWKLIEFYDPEAVELYNLKDDLGERNDLSGSQPEITRNLLRKLRQWQKEVGAKFPTINPDWKP